MQQSHAWTLLANGEPRDEVRDALTPDVIAAADKALAEVRFQLAPPTIRDQHAAIIVELGRYMSIGGGGWSPAQREEWIEGARHELEDFPAAMLIDSIRRARKRVRFPSEFVPWVVDDLEPAVDRLRIEEKRLSDLREIARS